MSSDILSGGTSGGDKDIANSFAQAQQVLSRLMQQGIGGLSPYNTAGQQGLSNYSDFLNGLLPKMNGAWAKDYQESPEAKLLTQTSLDAANNAAAGAGLLGGTGNRMEDSKMAEGIASEDMDKYFNRMMQQNNQYMGGTSDLSHMGLSSAGDIAKLLASLGGNLSSLITGQGAAEGASHQAGKSGKNSAIGGGIGGALSKLKL